MRIFLIFLFVVLVLGLVSGIFFLTQRQDAGVQSSLVLAPSSQETFPPDQFARATGPAPLVFPQDFGPHPDYQTEWWYYTGNLDSPDGRHFGYQLTFFRRALMPPEQKAPRPSDWSADQAYMAHFALTDVAGGKHSSFEKLSRGAAGLAGAQAAPYHVWLEDWSIEETAPGEYRLVAAQGGLALDLRLKDVKGPVLQGDQGYSRKGPEPGNASYYYSQTRLETEGAATVGGRVVPVKGLSWMDHEYSTSALSPGQVGWDWFSVQLDDDHELMLFQLRQQDGSLDPFSSGTIIYPDGSTRTLSKEDFNIQVEDHWKSPVSGAVYPSRWKVQVPSESITLEINPYLPDQEMDVSYHYWEGAVKVSGEQAGKPVTGNGYVELTGYADSMSGEF